MRIIKKQVDGYRQLNKIGHVTTEVKELMAWDEHFRTQSSECIKSQLVIDIFTAMDLHSEKTSDA